jgi:hypothetical protein
MEQEYRKQLGLDPEWVVTQTGSRREVKRGQDTDIETFDVRTADGRLVAQYEIHDSTATNPPFHRTVSYRKVGSNEGFAGLTPI